MPLKTGKLINRLLIEKDSASLRWQSQIKEAKIRLKWLISPKKNSIPQKKAL